MSFVAVDTGSVTSEEADNKRDENGEDERDGQCRRAHCVAAYLG